MTRSVLQFLCETANRFENTVLYSIRRNYFEKNQDFYLAPGRDDQPRMYRKSKAITGVSYPKLWKQFKTDSDYSLLGGQQAQQAIKSVVERVNSYNGLRKAYFNGTIERHPNLPGYRTSGGLVYRASNGQMVNADCNGAANIIAKVSTQLGITLAKVSKGALNLPKRYSAYSDLTRLYRGVADRITKRVRKPLNLESLVFSARESSRGNVKL